MPARLALGEKPNWKLNHTGTPKVSESAGKAGQSALPFPFGSRLFAWTQSTELPVSQFCESNKLFRCAARSTSMPCEKYFRHERTDVRDQFEKREGLCLGKRYLLLVQCSLSLRVLDCGEVSHLRSPRLKLNVAYRSPE